MSLLVDLGGLEAQGLNLEHLAAEIEARVQEALDQSAASILNALRTTFLREQDPSGKPWPKSHAALRREALGIGGGTLYNTGKLFQSIQLFRNADPNSRSIGTDVAYGIFAQTKNRVFLDLTPEHQLLAGQIFEQKLKQIFK